MFPIGKDRIVSFPGLDLLECNFSSFLEHQGQLFFSGSFNWMIFTKSLLGKWLEITKHPLKTGCLGIRFLPASSSHDLK